MAVDPRHIVAGVLTLTMFIMLGDMVKRDYYDAAHPHIHNSNKASELAIERVTEGAERLWKEDGLSLKPCWEKPLGGADESKGYVTFSLTNGPEYHVSQIADAVVVARYLRAKLVIPDIRGNKPGDKRNFEEVYDAEYFIGSLGGVVEVVKSLPAGASARNLAVVKVPNRVSQDYIAENIEASFREKRYMRLVTYFPSVNMKKHEERSSADSVACLGMFGTLALQSKVQQVVDSMIDHLRSLSRKSDGRFVAIDLRMEVLEKRGCRSDESGSKTCYNPKEIAQFLRKFGFDKDTTLYVTQTKWESGLNALKDVFPNTYTKESVLPAEKREDFVGSELEKVIDFYVCSESDVFVPAISGLFYANVAGKRIASGKTQILVPGASSDPKELISHYVSKRNHLAYSCFC